MTKIIKQIKILISCPRDVDNIKNLVEDCCTNFNPSFSKNDSIEFVVIHWKKNVNATITGERPQDIINREFEDQEYDIFIGIFWKRFGEKQSNGKTPTEEEYEIALKNHKKTRKPKIVKVYFKQDPTDMPDSEEEILQMGAVFNFKKRVQQEGVYVGFKEESFQKFFYKELLDFSYEFREPNKIVAKGTFASYKLNECHIERSLVKAEDYQKFNSLSAVTMKIKSSELVMRENRIVILGDAGTGKSEEVDFIAHYFSANDEGLIPLKIKLRNYVDQNIADFINEPYQKLSDENLLLLFDGFDEVESKNKMTLVRKILFYIDQHPQTRIVVTSRKNIYNNELTSFEVFYLLNLDDEDVENFISERL